MATEEAFRGLFEAARDERVRESACRAFAEACVAESARLRVFTQEGRRHDRLLQAYPTRPEDFDRLFQDRTTIDGFRRTRGALRAYGEGHRLWEARNKDADDTRRSGSEQEADFDAERFLDIGDRADVLRRC